MRFSNSAAAILSLAGPAAFAQTYTDCDPTKKTCPADTGLPSSSYSADFGSQGASANTSWSAAAYTTIDYGSDGAVFTIDNENQAPTIATDFYIFFGRTDVVFKAASGRGIVSSIVLESDDLDEIDWEFIGSSPNQVQSNYYGKGNTTTYDRVMYHNVADTQNTWHTYSVDWTSERIEFLIDGIVVRTLHYADAVNGQNFPQTPMRLKLGNWPAGASKSQGTVDWAGGKIDWSAAPFKMYVQKVSVQNYNPACSYEYGDRTGSWESIKVIKNGDGCSAGGSSTSAPTSSHSVLPVVNTNLPPATTITGSSYSTNTAAISAVNTATTTAMNTAVSGVSTGVASQPTVGVNGTFSGSGFAPTPTPSSSIEPSDGGSSLTRIMTAWSLLSLAVTFFVS